MSDEGFGTLKPSEAHPSSYDALDWLNNFLRVNPLRAFRLERHLRSKLDDRKYQILYITFKRLITGAVVSDRYLLGLCWYIRHKSGIR